LLVGLYSCIGAMSTLELDMNFNPIYYIRMTKSIFLINGFT
jgi:hypothetical protein